VDAANFAIALPTSTWVKSDTHPTEIIGGDLDCDGGSFKNPSAIGVTLAYWTESSLEQRLSAIGELIEPDSDRIIASWSSARPITRLQEEIIFPFSTGPPSR
jgi:hypothetical protein